MMDLDREQFRKTYEVSRLGFAILSTALVLACFSSLLDLLSSFDRELYLRIVRSGWYPWIDLPIVWGCLLGTTLLWGRWEHESWQRRSGLLLVMCLVDVVIWVLDHAGVLGRGEMEIHRDWLRANLGQALGWAEFALLASLSSDYLGHLGVDQARESAKAARSMAATGAVLWMLLFCERTNWGAGWPLRPHLQVRLETLLLIHGSSLIWTITLLQVTALVISATRQSRHVLEEMEREDEAVDPLRSRSNPPNEKDLLAVQRDGWS
jgi:hypothetical protein